MPAPKKPDEGKRPTGEAKESDKKREAKSPKYLQFANPDELPWQSDMAAICSLLEQSPEFTVFAPLFKRSAASDASLIGTSFFGEAETLVGPLGSQEADRKAMLEIFRARYDVEHLSAEDIVYMVASHFAANGYGLAGKTKKKGEG